MTAFVYTPPNAAPGVPPIAIWAEPSPVSSVGQTLSMILASATEYSRTLASDWRFLTKALIEDVASECKEPNWDGYGARPVISAAKDEAQRFVDMLPFHAPAPDPTADPNGEIALVWDFGRGRVLNVSVGSDGIVTYAGLLGGGVKRHGVERFVDVVPKVVLASLEELCERAGVTD